MEDAVSEKQRHTINYDSIRHNNGVLYYTRVYMSIAGGIAAGILGLTNVVGFLLYPIIILLTTLGVVVSVGFKWNLYFPSMRGLLLDGMNDGAMTYVLFWTLVYNAVHLF